MSLNILSTAVSRISFTTMAAVASGPTKTGIAKQLPAGRRVSPHTKWMETGPAAIVVNEMASHALNSRAEETFETEANCQM